MGFFETFVALRLLRGVKRQKGFLSLSTFISTAGVAVGVMALIIVIGVMTGFTQELKEQDPQRQCPRPGPEGRRRLHFLPEGRGRDQGDPRRGFRHPLYLHPGDVLGAGQRLRRGDPGSRPGDHPPGRPPDPEDAARDSSPTWRRGSKDDPPRIAIGNEMARNLNLSVGDYLNIISPLGTLTPMGRMPRMKAFRVERHLPLRHVRIR